MMQPFEDEIPTENELKKILDTLLPLRERKLRRLKRELCEHESLLRSLQIDLKKGEKRLVLFREQYQTAINEFANHHTGVVLLHEKLHRTLEKEKVVRNRLLKQESDNHDLITLIADQIILVDNARESVTACQREIEKLEIIIEEAQSS
ncbi:hypothetical protein C1Y41_04175 [Pantoea sp. ICBG 1758]|uniref:hypothetical protein n=1 Tax=Pantoea sp. ICBG 1758 TaxID=2071682 RepID=UPI000CE492C3|nr:hypothetical protein [Pantoea sp. ICBG 1758]PPC63848.1 hypothetical protein C1Y41_04175 [Pantoea sp. ICBG 1758]